MISTFLNLVLHHGFFRDPSRHILEKKIFLLALVIYYLQTRELKYKKKVLNFYPVLIIIESLKTNCPILNLILLTGNPAQKHKLVI